MNHYSLLMSMNTCNRLMKWNKRYMNTTFGPFKNISSKNNQGVYEQTARNILNMTPNQKQNLFNGNISYYG